MDPEHREKHEASWDQQNVINMVQSSSRLILLYTLSIRMTKYGYLCYDQSISSLFLEYILWKRYNADDYTGIQNACALNILGRRFNQCSHMHSVCRYNQRLYGISRLNDILYILLRVDEQHARKQAFLLSASSDDHAASLTSYAVLYDYFRLRKVYYCDRITD